MKDLCDDKKFPDLTDDLKITYKNKKIKYLVDQNNNVWINKGILKKGGFGAVFDFESYNKEYCDLAIKFFLSSKEAEEDMLQEKRIITLFNKHKCKNFLKAGIVELKKDNDLVVMEKIDGDLYDFDFKTKKNPLKIYSELVKFVVSGSLCALKKGKYNTDFKEENIGYKNCKEGVRFTFLDFGSFVSEGEEFSSTYLINKKGYDKNYFSKEIITVFSIIMTLLNLRLKIESVSHFTKFDAFLSKQIKKRNYPYTNLVTENLYKNIKEEYLKYFKKEDNFVTILLNCLEKLTEKVPNVKRFLNKIDYFD